MIWDRTTTNQTSGLLSITVSNLNAAGPWPCGYWIARPNKSLCDLTQNTTKALGVLVGMDAETYSGCVGPAQMPPLPANAPVGGGGTQ